LAIRLLVYYANCIFVKCETRPCHMICPLLITRILSFHYTSFIQLRAQYTFPFTPYRSTPQCNVRVRVVLSNSDLLSVSPFFNRRLNVIRLIVERDVRARQFAQRSIYDSRIHTSRMHGAPLLALLTL